MGLADNKYKVLLINFDPQSDLTDTQDFEIKHPIKNTMFDNIDWLRNLDQVGKLRPCVLENIEKKICLTIKFLFFFSSDASKFLEYEKKILQRH